MIRTDFIDSMEKAAVLFMEQAYNKDIDRLRSPYLYRGMPDASFRLATSLRRNCGSKEKQLEKYILENFLKYAIQEDPDIDHSVWEQMIVGQHHGLPTRLLDWSHSVMVAMHFATAEQDPADIDKRDGVVWRVDTTELARLLPVKYRDALAAENTTTFTVENLSGVVASLPQYDEDMGNKAMVMLEPASVTPRIVNQYSYFSLVPCGMEDMESFLNENTENTVRYIVSKEIRWELRDTLDQLNMSERMLFPGLEGISKWIARHYYVKNRD